MEAVDEEQGAITRPQTKPYHEVMKGYTYFEEGDIIWAKITPCMENGKSAVARGLRDSFAFGSTEFHVIRPTSIVIPEFIWHFVRQPSFRLEATRHFVGAVGQQRVPEVFLKNALLPLPPLTEQRAIIARLEAQMAQVQRLRAAAERQLEAARAMQGAILRQVFRYKEGESLPPGWRWVRLGEICKLIRGVDFQAGDYCRTERGGFVPILRAGNIGDDLDLRSDLIWVPASKVSEEQLLRRGDIVMCMSSGSPQLVGKSAMLRGTFFGSVGAFCAIIRVEDTVVADYVSYWLRSSLFLMWRDSQVKGANIQNLQASRLASVLLPLPTITEQRAIVARLEAQMAQVQRLRAAAERQLEATNALPGALLNEIFGGFEPPAEME